MAPLPIRVIVMSMTMAPLPIRVIVISMTMAPLPIRVIVMSMTMAMVTVRAVAGVLLPPPLLIGRVMAMVMGRVMGLGMAIGIFSSASSLPCLVGILTYSDLVATVLTGRG